MEYTEISFEELEKQYGLIDNPFVEQSSYNGKMFKTYGEELFFVREYAKNKRVVTILDAKRNDVFITSGFWVINRLGYLITKKPIEDNIIINDN